MRVGPAFLQTFAVQVAQTLASILTGVLIARGLGPAGQGHYAFFAAAVAFSVIIASFGQFEGNVLSSAGQSAAGRILLTRAILQSVGVLLILAAFFPVWRGFFARNGIVQVALMFPLILALEVQAQLIRGVNLGQHHITAYNVASLIQRLGNLCAILWLAFRGAWNLSSVLYAWAFAAALSTVVSGIWIWIRSDVVRLGVTALLGGWRTSVHRGARALVTIAFTVLLVRCDIWMLGHYLGSATVGQMSVASTLAEWLWYVPSILGNVLFAAAAADAAAATRQISRASRAIISLVVPAAIVLVVVGRRVVPLIYGSAYVPAGLLFVILVPGMSAIALHLVVDSFFAGRGFPAISIWSATGALVAKVGLNLVVIPRWGAAGAAAVTTLVYTSLAVVKVVAFRLETGTPVRAILLPTLQDFSGNASLARAWLVSRLGQGSV